MYKLVVSNKYKLYQSSFTPGNNKLLGVFNTVDEIIAYNSKFLNDAIVNNEIYEAVHFMNKANHNACEFGVRGLFTVSYWDTEFEV
jgi:hypothetical protein